MAYSVHSHASNLAAAIIAGEVQFSFVASSGPGGQNVNKVASKAQLRWNLDSTQLLSATQVARLRAKHGSKINKSGELVLTSDRFRDQPRNVADCQEKLVRVLVDALTVPKPRRKTKPTKASQRRRLNAKKRHSDKKSLRRAKPEY